MQGLVQGAEFDQYIEEQKQKELSQRAEEEKLRSLGFAWFPWPQIKPI